LAITGQVVMAGCLHNQNTLTWVEVIRDVRNKYPDVRQLQTDELRSWLSGSNKKSIFLIDARAKRRIPDKPYFRST